MHRSLCSCLVVIQTISHLFFSLSHCLETTPCCLSRCPGASHRRAALEKRKTSKTQMEIENENGTTVIDLPAALSPETDCSGRTLTSASLPSWTEEPGLDNPAFEESLAGDSTCRPRLCSPPCLKSGVPSFLPTSPHCPPTCVVSLFKQLTLRYGSHTTEVTHLGVQF